MKKLAVVLVLLIALNVSALAGDETICQDGLMSPYCGLSAAEYNEMVDVSKQLVYELAVLNSLNQPGKSREFRHQAKKIDPIKKRWYQIEWKIGLA